VAQGSDGVGYGVYLVEKKAVASDEWLVASNNCEYCRRRAWTSNLRPTSKWECAPKSRSLSASRARQNTAGKKNRETSFEMTRVTLFLRRDREGLPQRHREHKETNGNGCPVR
jgi:hypothetical protein